MCYMCTDASMCMLRAITSKAKPCTLIKLCHSVTSNTINKHDIVPLPLWHLEHGSMYVREGGLGGAGWPCTNLGYSTVRHEAYLLTTSSWWQARRTMGGQLRYSTVRHGAASALNYIWKSARTRITLDLTNWC